jgi:hypothetical protein
MATTSLATHLEDGYGSMSIQSPARTPTVGGAIVAARTPTLFSTVTSSRIAWPYGQPGSLPSDRGAPIANLHSRCSGCVVGAARDECRRRLRPRAERWLYQRHTPRSFAPMSGT